MRNILVLQSDFGLNDGAVSAMYGVSKIVDKDLEIHDLTHGVTPFQVMEGSYRLFQTVKYWPEGTVFVSVVDPGVGSPRKSVVAKTVTGHYIVTPDNGTLTHMKNKVGITEIREIDEEINRLKGSEESHTFHGRDVYAYTGARLASGLISFEDVGPSLKVEDIVEVKMILPVVKEGYAKGTIEVLDIRFGHLWSNISQKEFEENGFVLDEVLNVIVKFMGEEVYNKKVKYVRSQKYNIGAGNDWNIIFKKIK